MNDESDQSQQMNEQSDQYQQMNKKINNKNKHKKTKARLKRILSKFFFR